MRKPALLLLLALTLAPAPPADGASYTTQRAGNWSSVGTTGSPWWSSGAAITAYPGCPQAINSASAAASGAIKINVTVGGAAPVPATVGGETFQLSGTSGYDGSYIAIASSGTDVTLGSKFLRTWLAGGSGATAQTVTRSTTAGTTRDGYSTTLLSPGATSATSTNVGCIRLTLNGVPATPWAVGDVVTVTNVLGSVFGYANTAATSTPHEANGTWVVIGATNTTNATIDLAPRYVASFTGTARRGDSVTVGNAHAITCDVVGAIIGDDTANYNLQIGSSTFTMGAGSSLQVRGHSWFNGTFTMGASSTYEFGTTGQRAVFNFIGSGTNSRITTSGTGSGTRATIQAWSGAAYAQFNNSPIFQASYLNFNRIGAVGQSAFNNTLNATDGTTQSLDHCEFNTCGKIDLSCGANASGTQSFTSLTFRNSLSTTGTSVVFGWSAHQTSGTRTIAFISTDKNIENSSSFDGADIHDLIIAAALPASSAVNSFPNASSGYSSTVGAMTLPIRNTLLRLTSTVNSRWSWKDGYVVNCSQTTNPASIQPVGQAGTTLYRDVTIDGLIFDAPFGIGTGGGWPGDHLYLYDPSGSPSTVNLTVQNCMVLPVAFSSDSGTNGDSAGNLISTNALHSGKLKVNVFHNTMCTQYRLANGSAAYAGVWADEGAGASTYSAAGTFPLVRDNLAWNTLSANRSWLVSSNITGTYAATDLFMPAGCRNNAVWNVYAGTTSGAANSGNGYNAPFSTAPGTADLNLDATGGPNFVDTTRNIITWYRSLKASTGSASGDLDAACLELAKFNDDSGYDSRFTVPNLLAWVRAGFAPRNSILRAKAYDQSTVKEPGAVSGKFPVVPIINSILRRRRAEAAPIRTSPIDLLIPEDRHRDPRTRKAA